MLPSSPPPQDISKDSVVSPQGVSTLPYTFSASKATSNTVPGGSVKVIDSRTFNISKTIALAEVTVEWHPTQPEWSYFIEGEARITIFAASANAGTFNYNPATSDMYLHRLGITSRTSETRPSNSSRSSTLTSTRISR